MEKYNLLWFRRDFRLNDNAALYHSLNETTPVIFLFVFDTTILDHLSDKKDARVSFIHQRISAMKEEVEKKGGSFLVKYGKPIDVFQALLKEYDIQKVFANHDYEPYAIKRDQEVRDLLEGHDKSFESFKDQVIFEKDDILKGDGTPYTVFSPYMRKWKERFTATDAESYGEPNWQNAADVGKIKMLDLSEMGFEASSIVVPDPEVNEDLIGEYDKMRDFPAKRGTTRLSVHLRFGTVSVRKLVKRARVLNEAWLNELIWREFYMMILWHFPHSVEQSFKKKYDQIPWLNNESHFKAWCEGRTGYPIVDAGMRELNNTGFMHNRVRMIVASFLVKHLLVDWRWGEAYFAEKLLDFELSSNNGGWQWAASSGCDAAPYFRVFNPTLQTKKFDPQLAYIRKWVPEFEELNYPQPIVEHKFARERAIKTYKDALS